MKYQAQEIHETYKVIISERYVKGIDGNNYFRGSVYANISYSET